MANFREIPVSFVVDRARAQKCALEARPYRSLLEDWFSEIHCEIEGYESLHAIDVRFPELSQSANTISMGPAVVLPGCVLGRFRQEKESAALLVSIIHEIHRRMTIPIEESKKAQRPEDVRQTTWTWAHVMRVMIRRGIVAEGTSKSVFGAMIEQVLGEKVRANSIRRARHCNFDMVLKYDYDLSDADKTICAEIFSLFMPLFKTRN